MGNKNYRFKNLSSKNMAELDKWRCIMVDVEGTDEPNMSEGEGGKAVERFLAEGDKALDSVGNLVAEVRKFMSKWNLTDSGYGCGGWHLGCYCTWVEASELVDALYKRFEKAIKMKLIVIRPKVWSASLKE